MSLSLAETEKRDDAAGPTSSTSKPDGDTASHLKPGDKFTFTPAQLDELLDPKSLSAYQALGGLSALERGLRTDRQSGLSLDETVIERYATITDINGVLANGTAMNDTISSNIYRRKTHTRAEGGPFADRKHVFLDNTVPYKIPVSFFRLMWMAYNDHVLFLLTAAAIVSLAIGCYQAFSSPESPTNPRVQWVEGVAIITAITIIVLVGSVNDFERQRQFSKLDKKKRDREVKVIRSGKSQLIPIFDVLVGDVVHLEPGDMIPADGIFIDGYNVKCDESSVSGESRLIHKTAADEVFRAIQYQDQLREQNPDDHHGLDPFIISGTKVAEGVGTFLVTATGVNSSYGKILMSLHEEPGFTPLQVKLLSVAKLITKAGTAAALLLFIVLFVKFLVQLRHSTNTPAEKGQQFLNILIISLTVLVIAVPEGLPLAVTLALAFASNKMLKDNNLVRQLKACETMGNATSICSDKTGTLTQNKMAVVAGTFGTNLKFEDNSSASEKGSHSVLPIEDFVGYLAGDVKEVLKQSIAINATAFEGIIDSRNVFIGSRTETALLDFARAHLGMGPLNIERFNITTVQMIPFEAARQSMGVVVAFRTGHYRLYVKGASEVILRKSTRVIGDPRQKISDIEMDSASREKMYTTINEYASRSLRTIAFAYRDFDRWPLSGDDETDTIAEVPFEDLVFFGVVGIQDPLRIGAREAVQACQTAGVVVRMVTGDNILTAKAIAEQCGILSTTTDDIAMEGSQFRNLSRSEMEEIIPRLKVLARSSPEDKRTLVTRLKEMHETVAVTGDGTNDALALTAADVGFSMGISGTEIAREASSIVLLDDNFASIVKSIMWGRAVNDAVKQFLQFQITVSITSVMLTFVSAIANSQEQSVLTAVQLMWINLFQDTLAALALATDPPSRSILNRNPDPKSSPLINIAMWKMIIGQSIYQVAVTLILYFRGATILSYQTAQETAQLQTMVFNTYVWMQIFNLYNNRQLNNKFNILRGIWRNWFFIAISTIMVGGQILIAFFGGKAFAIARLTGVQWAISIVLGAISIPVGIVIRLIPDVLFTRKIWLSEASPIYFCAGDG